jgi:hypothetical protein
MMDLEPEEYFRNPKISAHVLKEKKTCSLPSKKTMLRQIQMKWQTPRDVRFKKNVSWIFSGVWFSLQTGDMTTK